MRVAGVTAGELFAHDTERGAEVALVGLRPGGGGGDRHGTLTFGASYLPLTAFATSVLSAPSTWRRTR